MRIVVAWEKYGVWHVGERVFGPPFVPVADAVAVWERTGRENGQDTYTMWTLFDGHYVEVET